MKSETNIGKLIERLNKLDPMKRNEVYEILDVFMSNEKTKKHLIAWVRKNLFHKEIS